jgi:pimeloyl-ACP methyl ester carboxylesterase
LLSCFFPGRDAAHRGDGEAEIAHPVEDAVQGRLIGQGAGQERLATLVVDSHPGTRAHRRQRRRPGSLLGLVDAVIGEEAFLLVGHSYGGYLARAIANHRPRQAAGLAVLCPIVEPGREDARPEDVVLHAADDLDLDGALEPEMAAEFRGYLVVHTPDTLRRFQ